MSSLSLSQELLKASMASFTENETKVLKSNKHFEIYLEYVTLYSVLKLKWTVQRQYALQISKIWQDMTRKLNNCGGPVRDATHWKKVFTEWKSHTRRKLKFNKPLNELEERLVKLIGLTSKPERNHQIKLQSYTNCFTNKQVGSSFVENMAILSNMKEETDICEIRERSRRSETGVINSNCTVQENKALSDSRNDTQKNCLTTDVVANENTRNGILHTEGLPMNRLSDSSTQVDDELMEISGISDRGSIGRGLQSLANALNRYCEIVEQRFA
ncbi:hypothetical protein HUJ04_011416 [Dendroctonus ponderosae]|nr:hypothetical protein HUJ04_011416 [Dendroctonus ponderosae]